MEDRKEFTVGPWRVTVTRSHILRSTCEKGSRCADGDSHPCTVCRFSRGLELPWLPDMVFPRNCLSLEHESGAGVEFWALDALKLVDAEHESVHVASAEQWRETRVEGLREVKEKMKPFDWTFTTTYSGTLKSSGGASIREEPTEDAIDYDLLKKQEKIFFFDDLVLFEDELADNGTAELRVKIRVMASGFFILLRFFLRVDGVIVRLNDTRLYHQAGTNHLLREVSCREVRLPNPKLSLDTLKDVNKLSTILPHTGVTSHKLLLPV